MTNADPVLGNALDYANRGWQVFPVHAVRKDGTCTCGKTCASPAKHPVTRRGLLDASGDPDTVMGWWRRWPWANLAIATGAASGIVVLDVDTDKGGTGSLVQLESEVGPLQGTLTSHTGGGGVHLVYRHPGVPVKTRARAFGPGLDIRGDGGYIVAPPSRHISGDGYAWDDLAVPIAHFPAALSERLNARQVQVPSTVVPLRRPGSGGTPYGLTALQGLVDELLAAPEGARNDTLNRVTYRVARLIAGGELEGDQTLTVIGDAAAGIGLVASEIRATIQSATQAGTTKPASAPPRAHPVPHTQRDHTSAPADDWAPPTEEPSADDAGKQELSLGQQLAQRLLSASELASMPPPTWLVDDVLGVATLAVLYGKPGSGKSFLALDWALSVAAGMPWNGREVHGGTVLYVAAEGVGGLGIRVRAWTETFGVSLHEVDDIQFFPTAINLLDATRRQALIEMAMTLDPTLVIIDTLARSMVGGDENSTRDVGLAIDTADAVRAATAATVLVVHHTSKGGETYRGSSSIEGAADTMILVEAEGPNLTVKCEKAKDAEQFEPIKLKRRVVTLRGETVTSCVLESHSQVGTGEDLKASEQAIIATMWDQFGTTAAVSRKELFELVKLPKTTFYRTVKRLVSNGALLNVGTMKLPAYKLPSAAVEPSQSHSPTSVPPDSHFGEESPVPPGVSRKTPGWDSLEPDWARPPEEPMP
jgi:hypothetical protein